MVKKRVGGDKGTVVTGALRRSVKVRPEVRCYMLYYCCKLTVVLSLL